MPSVTDYAGQARQAIEIVCSGDVSRMARMARLGRRKVEGRSWLRRVSTGIQGPGSTRQPPAAVPTDRLLRPDQAAWYLNIKTSWIYEAVKSGRLPCHRVGRYVRFTRPVLDAWLVEQPRR